MSECTLPIGWEQSRVTYPCTTQITLMGYYRVLRPLLRFILLCIICAFCYLTTGLFVFCFPLWFSHFVFNFCECCSSPDLLLGSNLYTKWCVPEILVGGSLLIYYLKICICMLTYHFVSNSMFIWI